MPLEPTWQYIFLHHREHSSSLFEEKIADGELTMENSGVVFPNTRNMNTFLYYYRNLICKEL